MNNDLISREALKKAFEDCAGECACCVHNTNDFNYCGLIDNAPTVDVPDLSEYESMANALNMASELLHKRRPHGKWIKHEWGYICSECNETNDYAYDNNIHKFVDNFCPNCGAKMDKE